MICRCFWWLLFSSLCFTGKFMHYASWTNLQNDIKLCTVKLFIVFTLIQALESRCWSHDWYYHDGLGHHRGGSKGIWCYAMGVSNGSEVGYTQSSQVGYSPCPQSGFGENAPSAKPGHLRACSKCIWCHDMGASNSIGMVVGKGIWCHKMFIVT